MNEDVGGIAERLRDTTYKGRLEEAVAMHMFATPNAADCQGTHGGGQGRSLRTDVRMYPTPDARDSHAESLDAGRRMLEKWGTCGLTTAAKLFPTPAAQDAKNSTLPESQRERDTLPGELLPQQFTGQLNQPWVEWLMGWPFEWTSVEPLPDTSVEWWRERLTCGEWWATEPPIPRVALGVKNRCERIKALGNGQVPLCAAVAWSILSEDLERRIDT